MSTVSASPVQAQVPIEADRLFTALLDAVKAESYENFIALGSHCFQHGVSQEMFAAVGAQVGAFLRQGYEATYLGLIRRKGHEIHLWKLAYADGGDDNLAHLTFLEGKATGFWLT